MCDWCGREHDVRALCSARPKWGRRGFLSFMGIGALGLAANPAWPAPLAPQLVVEYAMMNTANGHDVIIYRYFNLTDVNPRRLGVVTGTS